MLIPLQYYAADAAVTQSGNQTLSFSSLLISRIVVERFGKSFKTLNISKYKIPDEAWDSGSPIEYLKRLVIKKLGLEGVLPVVNGSQKDGEHSEHNKSGVIKEDDKQFELPFNKAGNKFSGTVRQFQIKRFLSCVSTYIRGCPRKGMQIWLGPVM